MGEGIFELRYRRGTERFRLLFIFWGRHLVALTAFQKKQQKTPKPDLDKARIRARRWRQVFGMEPPKGGAAAGVLPQTSCTAGVSHG